MLVYSGEKPIVPSSPRVRFMWPKNEAQEELFSVRY